MEITIKTPINSSKTSRNKDNENTNDKKTETAIKTNRISNPTIRYNTAYSLGLRTEKYCFFI